jgi:hypothetical protein
LRAENARLRNLLRMTPKRAAVNGPEGAKRVLSGHQGERQPTAS